MFWLAYVLIGSSPMERMGRGCMPVNWAGRAATTVAAVFSSGAEARMQAASAEAFDGCRFFLFRQFYAEELRELRKLRDGGEGADTSAEAAGKAVTP